eukprot:scaffold13312_cov84-Isochrysis_galbana.AAC.1
MVGGVVDPPCRAPAGAYDTAGRDLRARLLFVAGLSARWRGAGTAYVLSGFLFWDCLLFWAAFCFWLLLLLAAGHLSCGCGGHRLLLLSAFSNRNNFVVGGGAPELWMRWAWGPRAESCAGRGLRCWP